MEDSATTSVTSIWASLNSWFTSTVFFVLLNLMIATIVFTSNLPSNNQEQEDEQKQNSPNENHRNQPKIARSPSILHRLKSFTFSPQRPEQEFTQETHHHLKALEVAATQYVFNQPLHYQHFHSDELRPSDSETHFDSDEVRPSDLGTHFDSDPTREEIREDTGSEDAHEDEEQSDKFQSLDEVYSRLNLKGGHVDRTQSDGAVSRKPAAKMKKSASLKVGFSHFEEEIVEARRPATMRERKSAVRVTEDDDDDDVEVDAKADDFINKFKNDLMLQRIESIAGRSK